MDVKKFIRRYTKHLYWIERHDFITPKQYARYRDISANTAGARLNKFVGLGYLDKIRPARQFGDGSMPTFYFITKKGAKQISDMLDVPREDLCVRANTPTKQPSTRFLMHTMKTNDFFTQLIDSSMESKYPGICKWLNTRECRVTIPSTGEDLLPDGYGEFDIINENICFWVEIDRGTETISIASDKFIRYAEYCMSGRWRDEYYVDEYPRLLFRTNNASRALSVKRDVEKKAQNLGYLDVIEKCQFLISWEEEDDGNDILGESWLRTGYDDGLVSFIH